MSKSLNLVLCLVLGQSPLGSAMSSSSGTVKVLKPSGTNPLKVQIEDEDDGEEADAEKENPLTANIGVVSDYLFRGITATDHEPAVQAGIDWKHASGLRLGFCRHSTKNIHNPNELRHVTGPAQVPAPGISLLEP